MSTTAERLAAYQAAELKILEGQSITAFGRMLTMADLGVVQATISRLQAQLNRETASGNGNRRRGFGSSLSNFNTREVLPDGRTARDDCERG